MDGSKRTQKSTTSVGGLQGQSGEQQLARLCIVSAVNDSRLYNYVHLSGHLSEVLCAGTLKVCVISGY